MSDPSEEDRARGTLPLAGRVVAGVAWMSAARVSVRLLGLLSTLVLARLLTPGDFGLVAMAMSVAAAIELLTSFSFDTALVQKKSLERVQYDTAWTLNLVLGIGLGAALLLAAEAASRFYREPRLADLMFWIALMFVVGSAANIGTVDFRRQLDFRKEFVLQISPKVASLVATLPAAFLLRDYRALVLGMLVAALTQCVVSFMLHPFRPRFSVAGAGDLFRFSRWLLLNNLFGFLRRRSADFVVGRALGAAPLGTFSIAAEIGNLPSSEMVAPVNRVLFPAYVKLVGDPARLRGGYRRTLGFVALAVVPASAGLAAVADPLVRVMLGQQWLATIPIVGLLAIAGAANVLQANLNAIFIALGRPGLVALSGGVQALTLIPMLVAGVTWDGLRGAAIAILVHSVCVVLPTGFGIAFRCTPITWGDVTSTTARPVAASAVMFLAVQVCVDRVAATTFLERVGLLLGGSALGALFYVALIALLWLVVGRPDGAEAACVRWLRGRLAAGRGS